MITVVEARNCEEHLPLVQSFHALYRTQTDAICDIEHPDTFGHLNPIYLLGIDPQGQVTSGMRLLRTTGPHLLSQVLNTGAPQQGTSLYEASMLCIDHHAMTQTQARQALRALILAALDHANNDGIPRLLVLFDPRMKRLWSQIDPAPVDYLVPTRQGFYPVLLECSAQRIKELRAAQPDHSPRQSTREMLRLYCEEQIKSADTPSERAAAEALHLELSHLIDGVSRRRCNA